MTFVGTALLTRDGGHIRVEYFVEKFSKNIRLYIDYVINIFLIILLIYIIRFSFIYMELQEGMISQSLGLPYSFFSFGITIGLIFTVFYSFKGLLFLITSKKSRK